MGIRRRTFEEAREIVENYHASTLTRDEYCREHDLKISTLQWLRVRLRRHKIAESLKAEQKSGFTRIELQRSNEPVTIKVIIGPVNIELPENFKSVELQKILTAVQSCHV